MNRYIKQTTREERKTQLTGMWKDKAGHAAVLSLFHRALPEGETPRAGMSIIEVILDHEFGKQEEDQPNLTRQSA